MARITKKNKIVIIKINNNTFPINNNNNINKYTLINKNKFIKEIITIIIIINTLVQTIVNFPAAMADEEAKVQRIPNHNNIKI